MVIIMKKIDKGFFVHIQGYTFFSGRGTSISEAIGSLILNHAQIFKIELEWDENDELTQKHIGK